MLDFVFDLGDLCYLLIWVIVLWVLWCYWFMVIDHVFVWVVDRCSHVGMIDFG